MSFSYPHYGALLRQQPILELLHGARKTPNGCPQAQLVDDTCAPRISNVRVCAKQRHALQLQLVKDEAVDLGINGPTGSAGIDSTGAATPCGWQPTVCRIISRHV